jgi:hypothetical protein
MDDRHTAPCGLCCLDCIPSRHGFFQAVRALEDQLGKLRFHYYAELKARQIPALADYARFLEVLNAIESLECPAPCMDGGGSPDCRVKACVAERGLRGCWQCDERRGCDRLAPLLRVHPNLLRHLDLIAEHGPVGWLEHRGPHYRWDEHPPGRKGE